MHDGVTNKYSFEMNERLITLLSLISKQIYEEQLKLKEKMVEKKSMYIRGTSLLTRFFLVLMMMLFFDLILIC
jgi:uncharacterized membrane protein YbjE (DUF340 family)